MSIQDTDTFLVNRNGSSYHLESQNLMAELQDDDLMLVNRGGLSYKATGAEIKETLGGAGSAPPVIGSVTLTEQNPNASPRFTNQEFDVTVGMFVDDGATKTIDASVYTEGFTTYETSQITNITNTARGNWENLNPKMASNERVTSVLYSSVLDKWLAVGQKGTLSTSPDSKTWTKDTTNSLSSTETVRFCAEGEDKDGNYLIIVVGKNYYLKTADMVTYQKIGTPWADCNKITYGNGTWLVTGGGGSKNAFVSKNGGDSWDEYPIPDWKTVSRCGFSDGWFVAGGTQANTNTLGVWKSRDAINWEWVPGGAGVMASFQDITGVEHPNFDFMAGGSRGNAMLASDVDTWNKIDNGFSQDTVDPMGENVLAATYSLGNMFYAGYPGVLTYSSNGTSWTRMQNPAHQTAYWCMDSGQGYVVVGGNENSMARVKLEQQVVSFADNTNFDKITIGARLTTKNNGATGTVYALNPDASPPTMNLTAMEGSWTNGDTCISPPISTGFTTKYLQFDNSGNVTDLLDSPQSPPYTTLDENPQLTLTFPGTFPSGQTPDKELSLGTTITAKVTAANSGGSYGPVSSNTVTPSDTTTVYFTAVPEEEFIIQQALHLTYDYRKAVHQGELAAQQRQYLQDTLTLTGLSDS